MWPHIGPFKAYGVFYFAAFVVHFLVSWRIARRHALKWPVWIIISVLFLLGSTLGAKILHDFTHNELDWHAIFTAQHYMRGGYWGGLLAYLGLGLPAAWLLSKKQWSALDLVALTVPIPFMLAKVGCLLNGCCYGRPSSLPWAIVFPETSRGAPPGIPCHPTQIYEMIAMVLIMCAFKWLDRRRWQGTMVLWFLLILGLGRALTESFRGDLQHYVSVGPFTLTQLVCLGGAVVSAGLLFWWRRRPLSCQEETSIHVTGQESGYCSSGGDIQPKLSGDAETIMDANRKRLLKNASILALLITSVGFAFWHAYSDLAQPASFVGFTSFGVLSDSKTSLKAGLPVIIYIANLYQKPKETVPQWIGQFDQPVLLIWCDLLSSLDEDTALEDVKVWKRKKKEFARLLSHYHEVFEFDAHRVYLTGAGFAGSYAWMLAYDQPDLIAGVVALSAPAYPPPIQQRLDRGKSVVTVAIYGENDRWLTNRFAQVKVTKQAIEARNPHSKLILKPNEDRRQVAKYWIENLRYILQFSREVNR